MVTLEILSKLIGGDRYGKKYKIRLTNGKSIIKQMWATEYGSPVIAKPHARCVGWVLTNDYIKDWDCVTLYDPKKMSLLVYDARAKKALKLLENSGLWSGMKKEIEHYLSLPTNVRQEMLNDILTDSYHLFYCKRGEGEKYEWVRTFQMFESFANKNGCWKYPRYTYMHNKAYLEQNFAQAKENNTKFTDRWTNGYDVTYSVDFSNEEKRGWLSDEFRGCGNGHYYLLLDATHAINYEDD